MNCKAEDLVPGMITSTSLTSLGWTVPMVATMKMEKVLCIEAKAWDVASSSRNYGTRHLCHHWIWIKYAL